VRREPGAQADPDADVIAVDGRTVPAPAAHAYVVLYKPRGYVTTRHDPAGRPVVTDLLPPALRHVVPVGRLDFDAEGLLLLTNDGELANRLLHPRYGVPRVYQVDVRGRVARGDVGRWRRGTILADGPAVPLAVRIEGSGADRTRLTLSLTEGRKHEVKRYCAALGHPVVRLVRVAFGPLTLRGLRPGAHRRLTPHEFGRLNRLRGP
jgi:pseudouridine synthase